MLDEDLARRIVELVLKADYRPLKPKGIAQLLGLGEEQRYEFRRTLKRLILKGSVAYGSNHLVFPPGGLSIGTAPETKFPQTLSAADSPTGKAIVDHRPTAADEIVGTLRRSASGNGYVRPRGVGPAHRRQDDVFVPERYCGDATQGDVVLVRIVRSGGHGRAAVEGRVLKVLERQSHVFVGTYFEQRGKACVKVDGQVFLQPIQVGDPGAKGARLDDKVVVEIVRFPTHALEGEGVIVEVLGPRGRPEVDTLTILREFDLEETFPQEVVEQTREEARRFEQQEAAGLPADRVDLSADTIITIDPATARDFDDAISLIRHENGHWRLGVHIADVAYFVKEGTPLDQDARRRATSVYLPDRVVPMLPELISNGLASLQPGKLRYTHTVDIDFSPDGVPTAVKLSRTAIRSAHRFSYEEVDEFLASPEAFLPRCSAAVHDLLGRMRDLARVLRSRRMERGSLVLNMPEVQVDFDRSGKVSGAHVRPDTESHWIIEEFMLAANEAVAETLFKKGLIFIRRIHLAPDFRKLKSLTEFVRGLGFDVDGLESRFELQQLLKQAADLPQKFAVHYAVLRSLQRAVYSPEEEGHFALASDCYCHFTSPIRRYPDLTIHRLVDDLIDGRPPQQDPVRIAMLAEHCSQQERKAEEAERELTKLKMLNYLAGKLGLELAAVITGVEDFGFFVQGIELPAEGLVHVTSLPDDFYDFDRVGHKLTGRRTGASFCLGDMVQVKVAHVDVDARVLDFRLIGKTGRAPRPAQLRKGSTRTGARKQARFPKASHGKKPGKPKPGQKGKRKRK